MRRAFLTRLFAGAALSPFVSSAARSQEPELRKVPAPEANREITFEPIAEGTPHKGKVLLAVQAHSDDIPLTCPGVVAKLVKEGYTGYLVRATNDDMGDAPGLGMLGTIGDHVTRNEQDNAEVARVLGLKKVFDLNYPNHRMGDASLNELICRLIFIIRLLKVDTVVSFDPWGPYEENPDHLMIARGVEAACWMAGRKHDYPEQLEAGLEVKTVTERYYYARRPNVNRVVDCSGVVEEMIDCNRANRAKGPAGTHGSQLRAELEKQGLKLPLLNGEDKAADRRYIEHFILARSRELGEKYGVRYAEAFQYIDHRTPRKAVDEYIKQNAVPAK
jgi:LmbE family N-acetylglucosaminyl deacetylase